MTRSISVVVCTYNRVDSLRRCVQALQSINTLRNWELVIVDNGSTDGTSEFLYSLPERFGNARLLRLRETKPGLGPARNCAWRMSTGDIVAFTDDDCYVAPDYVDAVASAFERGSHIGFIGGRILLYDQTDIRMTVQESEEYTSFKPHTFIPAGAVQGSNMAFRRSTLDRVGGFDGSMRSGTDIDICAAALWAGIAGAYDPRPTVYHHHGRKSQADAVKLMARYDRGRGAYYMKYIVFNNAARWKYLNAWSRSIWREFRNVGTLSGRPRWMSRSFGEIRGGLSYLRLRYLGRTERF